MPDVWRVEWGRLRARVWVCSGARECHGRHTRLAHTYCGFGFWLKDVYATFSPGWHMCEDKFLVFIIYFFFLSLDSFSVLVVPCEMELGGWPGHGSTCGNGNGVEHWHSSMVFGFGLAPRVSARLCGGVVVWWGTVYSITAETTWAVM